MKTGRRKTHGQCPRNGKRSPEWTAWNHMKRRCYNPNYKGYKYYGGRGIIVCERWMNSFENFLADMGKKPSPSHSLDRYPNNDGNYEPGNCRWATAKEQANNKRQRKPGISTRAKKTTISIFGTEIPIDVIVKTGMTATAIRYRVKQGFSLIDAIKTERQKPGPKV